MNYAIFIDGECAYQDKIDESSELYHDPGLFEITEGIAGVDLEHYNSFLTILHGKFIFYANNTTLYNILFDIDSKTSINYDFNSNFRSSSIIRLTDRTHEQLKSILSSGMSFKEMAELLIPCFDRYLHRFNKALKSLADELVITSQVKAAIGQDQ